ncbi:phage antirepressor KilAC domain-containing protein [Weissella soli]|uniref:Anti-repressor protein n=1 Tax=Weissella soli TaxID=155866 RepID=A0A288QXN9_9LACO|nr:phage antirepressor KilAC domain-containing protein [Weissella soli]AOT56591.1 hypothetical protein WSWS_00960 [Weissella soli]NKY83043.1 oxidoreductase [Weissella soli]RDL12156.1 anti-repressor protein [Weissella soli]GEN92607.1 oxidoreductase [Weissella soli]
MNNELIKVQATEQGEQRVSARELYKALEIAKTYRFNDWFKTNSKLFNSGMDFTSVVATTVVNNGATRQLDDYLMTIEMAKHIAMMSGTTKGYEVRNYFIQVEKAFNSPEMMMARSLEYANKKLIGYEERIAEMKPKALFADAVSASQSSILIGELAKLLKQNGVEMGQNRLFTYLRENGYLVRRMGSDRNMPTQKSMELGLFEIKEHNHINSNGVNVTTKTPKVTGKGQQYFINKFLGEQQ